MGKKNKKKIFCPNCGKTQFPRFLFNEEVFKNGGRVEECKICQTVFWIPLDEEKEIEVKKQLSINFEGEGYCNISLAAKRGIILIKN